MQNIHRLDILNHYKVSIIIQSNKIRCSDFACAKYASDIFVKTNGLFVYYDANTKNSPYKAGATQASEGLCLITGDPDTYFSAFSFDKGGDCICIYVKSPGGVTNWRRLV